MSDCNDLKDRLKQAEKDIKVYKRRLHKLEKTLAWCEKTRDHYSQFYAKSIDTLKEKQVTLDQRNQELLYIKESLAKQNSMLSNNQLVLKKLNQQLNDIAYIDSLTGLKNRKSFDEKINNIARNYSVNKLSLFLIDLDGFKDINDNYGHDAGDALLREVANRLIFVVQASDTIFRLGGDEFVVLVESLTDVYQLNAIAIDIVQACAKSMVFNNRKMKVSASIGIANYPEHYDPKSSLDAFSQIKRAADIAMYRAKNQGKNTHCFFDEKMSKEADRYISDSQCLQRAISEETLEPYFQIQYCCHTPERNKNIESTAKLFGIEALVRWPDRPNLKPDNFLPLVQQLGLISDLDLIILKKVCMFISEHRFIFDKVGYIAVNYAAETFSSSYHIDRTFQLLKEYDISPHRIMIELTEKGLLSTDTVTQSNVKQLEMYGVQLALDDFGTGYSSIENLHRMKFNYLKIDRSFVQLLNEGDFYTTVIPHIYALAKDLNIDVIAEGIENYQQLSYLSNIGIEKFQGYIFSQPMSKKTLLKSLQTM